MRTCCWKPRCRNRSRSDSSCTTSCWTELPWRNFRLIKRNLPSEVRYGRFPTLVHPVCAVLAAGLVRARRLPLGMAAEHSVPHRRHHTDRSVRAVERDFAAAAPLAAWSARNLVSLHSGVIVNQGNARQMEGILRLLPPHRGFGGPRRLWKSVLRYNALHWTLGYSTSTG